MKLNAEENLTPVRQQLLKLVQPNSKVLEVGCGKGTLLLALAPQIKAGLGIDASSGCISAANKLKERHQLHHIDFKCETLGTGWELPYHWDYTIASLFFHVIPPAEALYLLERMVERSDQILICGFSRPQSLKDRWLVWADQRFRGHYQHFKAYRKIGYCEGLLAGIQDIKVTTYNTNFPFLKIFSIHKNY